jgi:hypothetical protein
MNIHINNGTTPSAPHSSNESVADEPDGEMPDLINTPDNDEGSTIMENIPQMNGITYNLGQELESDEEEFMGQFHSIAPPIVHTATTAILILLWNSLSISVVNHSPEID